MWIHPFPDSNLWIINNAFSLAFWSNIWIINKQNNYTMKRNFIYAALVCCLVNFISCNISKNENETNSIVGIWNEYRADGDNYLLSSWKFNSDGSGIFIVKGMTNTQRVPFIWKKRGSSTIEININNDGMILELNNGLLIEKGNFGTTIFKKQ